MASRSHTANTIDLDSLIKFYNPHTHVLSESLSIHDLSLSDEADNASAPPFPASRPTSMIHAYHISALNRDLSAHPDNRRFTLAAPTPPRLRSMIQETFNIDRWAETLSSLGAPDHIPWENQQTESSKPSPSRQPATKAAHILKSKYLRVQKEEITPPWSKAADQNASLDISDIMADLQDLNLFFKNGLEDMENLMAVIGDQKDRLKEQQASAPKPNDGPPCLPELVVSDSHDAIQVPVGNRKPPDTPLEIANRRGKKPLPPIVVSKLGLPTSGEDISYPGIPTAFLGTPSGRSASSVSFNLSPESSPSTPVPLQEMVKNLRSQCASIQRHIRDHSQIDTQSEVMKDASNNDQDNNANHSKEEKGTKSKDNRDSWTFADDFLQAVKCEVYQAFPVSPQLQSHFPLVSASPSNTPPTPTKPPSPIVQPPPAPRKASPLTRTKTHTQAKSTPRRSVPTLPSPPPSKGILRPVKNVRFVEPNDVSDTDSEPQVLKPIVSSGKNSSPPKSCLVNSARRRHRASLEPSMSSFVTPKDGAKENVTSTKPRRYTIGGADFKGSMRSLARHYREGNGNGNNGERGVAGGNNVRVKEKEKEKGAKDKKQTPLKSIFTRLK